MDNASVWISDTTVEDKHGKQWRATYIALWLGVAVHSQRLWKEFFGDWTAGSSIDAKPAAPYPQLCTRSAEYRDPELFKQFRSAMMHDSDIELRTECGVHMTLGYAGPMDKAWQGRLQKELNDRLYMLRKLQDCDPFVKVEKLLRLKRHQVNYCEIAASVPDYHNVDLTEVPPKRVEELLNSGRIDTQRYSDPKCDDLNDIDHQREKFAEWMRGAYTRKQKALIHAVLLDGQGGQADRLAASEDKKDRSGSKYTGNWKPMQYRDPPYWTVWGSTAWEWGFYLKAIVHQGFQQVDMDTNKNFWNSKKGHRMAPRLLGSRAWPLGT